MGRSRMGSDPCGSSPGSFSIKRQASLFGPGTLARRDTMLLCGLRYSAATTPPANRELARPSARSCVVIGMLSPFD